MKISLRAFFEKIEYLYSIPVDVWALLGTQSANFNELRTLVHHHPAVTRKRVYTNQAIFRKRYGRSKAQAAAAGR